MEYTIFDFPDPVGTESSNLYNFSIEPESFIQLMILGNIIQHRKGGMLEGVAQHLEDFCRIKHDNLGTEIGVLKRFTVNNHVQLEARLSLCDPAFSTSEKVATESPVLYQIEVHPFRSLDRLCLIP